MSKLREEIFEASNHKLRGEDLDNVMKTIKHWAFKLVGDEWMTGDPPRIVTKQEDAYGGGQNEVIIRVKRKIREDLND